MISDKQDNLQKQIFRLVILLLPTQLCLYFWPGWSLVQGLRIDYFSPKLYIVDIFVILYLVIYFWKSSEKIVFKSQSLLVFILITTNLAFSLLFPNSFFYILRISTYFLFLYLALKVKKEFYNDLVKPLTFSLVGISIIGLFQFLFQKNLGGIFYLLGERFLIPTSHGAPLFEFFGLEYLRSQSTFSHPNSFAGYLVVGLCLVVFTKFPKKDLIYKKMALVFSIASLLFSFSEVALFALGGLGVFYFFFKNNPGFLKRILLVGPFVFVIISLLFLPISENLIKRGGVYHESIMVRMLLARQAKNIITKNAFYGVGANNFILALSKNPPVVKSVLFLQPVHNVFLLIFSEWGIFGLAFFTLFGYQVVYKLNHISIKVALFFIFFLGVFDHYFLTLNQNMFLFALILAFGWWGSTTLKDSDMDR